VLNRLVSAYKVADLSALAEKTSWPIGTIYSWRRRGSVPEIYLHEAANATGHSFAWLQKGPMGAVLARHFARERESEVAGADAPAAGAERSQTAAPGDISQASAAPGMVAPHKQGHVESNFASVAIAANRLGDLYKSQGGRLSPLWEALALHLLLFENLSDNALREIFLTAKLSGHVGPYEGGLIV
jgi:hypothetical protein